MANTLKILAQAVLGAAAAVYTVPALTTGVVKSMTVCNQDAASQTFSIWIVKSGDARATKNKIFKDVQLLTGESVVISGDYYLEPGDAVHVSGTDADMSVTISGVEMA